MLPSTRAFLRLVFTAWIAATSLAYAQPATLVGTGHQLVAPKPVVAPKAVYPVVAQAKGEEGSVTVLADLDATGAVRGVSIAVSSGIEVLDDAALEAARKWRFSPALDDDKAIESQIRIPFHFHHVELPPDPGPAVEPPVTPPPSETPPPVPPQPTAVAPMVSPDLQPTSPYESSVRGSKEPPSRGTSDYHIDVENLSLVPRANAAEILKLAPGIMLTNEGGDAHAEQVFLRGFDAREGQDIEFSVDGTPINESGNLHGNGYSDTHFIIPELVESLRVVEGPFDPRQGNYAVAGSADYHLGLRNKGLTAKFTIGSYGTYRMLLAWAPQHGSPGTFAAVELYQTRGFGQNRDGRRGSAMAQWEGKLGSSEIRLSAQAYIASFHTAGVIRQDDFQAGRVGFYDTYDSRQGEDSQRYSASAEITSHTDHITFRNLLFGIARPLRIREDFTGYSLDVQTPLQTPHDQRGDLLDLNVMEGTVGLRGSARLHGKIFKQEQELELGYFARGDFVSSSQQRVEASTGHPYQTDADLDSRLGDIGLYADANLRFTRWLSLRGGARGDLFTYDVNDHCAVPITGDVGHPTAPVGDASCLSIQNMGAHREPNQRASTVSGALMPRGSLLLGPWKSFSASVSAGKGVRSIDPQYITQDVKTPFASVSAYEGGLTYQHRFRDSIDLQVRSVAFYTHVNHDLIFSQTVGRNVLANGTTRIGSASSARFTGAFWDLAANLTYTKATFDDTGLLVPYVPDLVVRADGALFGDLPWWKDKLRGHALRASLSAGLSYVGPRALPYGARSNLIATLDGSASVGWWFVDLSVSAQNLTDRHYRLGEYNYVSDFHSTPYPGLVPVRHFSAGAPRTVMFTIALNYGGRS